MPIITDIENKAKTLIEGMTTAGGYNFDWGTVNEFDMTLQTFPSAEIFITRIDNLDLSNGGIHSNAYENEAFFEIRVRNQLSTETNDPNRNINTEFNKALDDLLEVFGLHTAVQDAGAQYFMFNGMRREYENQGDRFIPGVMITTWRARYSQDRQDPTQPGDI